MVYSWEHPGNLRGTRLIDVRGPGKLSSSSAELASVVLIGRKLPHLASWLHMHTTIQGVETASGRIDNYRGAMLQGQLHGAVSFSDASSPSSQFVQFVRINHSIIPGYPTLTISSFILRSKPNSRLNVQFKGKPKPEQFYSDASGSNDHQTVGKFSIMYNCQTKSQGDQIPCGVWCP